MSQTIALTSVANGLSARSIFLPFDKNLIHVVAPDWNSSKTAQIHTSPIVDGVYTPEHSDLAGTTVLEFTGNTSVELSGPVHVKLHLASPGSGASLVFVNPYGYPGDDIGNWLLEQLVWNDYGVWLDDQTWVEE